MSTTSVQSQLRKFNIGDLVETTPEYVAKTTHYSEAVKKEVSDGYHYGVIKKIEVRLTIGSSLIEFEDKETGQTKMMDETFLQSFEGRGRNRSKTSVTVEDILNKQN